MSAYLIVMINVTDRDRYQEYMNASPGVTAEFGGRFVARGGETIVLEGQEPAQRIVLIEFPSLEHIKAFYHSDAYQEIKKLREGAAIGTFIAVDGVQSA